MKTSYASKQLRRAPSHFIALAACIYSLGFSLDGLACHRGNPHGGQSDCGTPPPPANEVTYDITYEFGELTGGLCVAPACVATSVTATGTVECESSNSFCMFRSRALTDDFRLPSGLRDLLFATEWRNTPLDPDQCFGSSEANPGGGVAMINNREVNLRAYLDEATPWYAVVHADALDTEGLEVRHYTFNFEGCGETSCGVFGPDSVAGTYDGGRLVRIDGAGNDRKFLSVPCRCTISNTPDCPQDVPVPTPPIRIMVSEVP